MFGWSFSSAGRPAASANGIRPAAGSVVHDDVHVRVLGLLVNDTFRWKREWAAWRVRFAYENDHPGQGFRDVAAFVREMAAGLCKGRAEAAEIVLYLADIDDVKAVFRAYGGVPQGVGQISAVQDRSVYLQAAQFAAELAALSRAPDVSAEAEIFALPDLTWEVRGAGMSRVATAALRGRSITVRLGVIGGSEMWVVDINNAQACARFQSRADAMSKMGVAAALKSYAQRRG